MYAKSTVLAYYTVLSQYIALDGRDEKNTGACRTQVPDRPATQSSVMQFEHSGWSGVVCNRAWINFF